MGHISYFFLKSFMTILGILPLKVHYFLSAILARLIEKVFKYRRDDVIINLARCFPEKQYWEIEDLCHKFYRHFADVFVEAIWFGASFGPGRVRRSHIVELVNPENVAHIVNSPKGGVILCSHYGNWELTGGFCQYNYTDTALDFREDNMCVVYRQLSSKVWDRIMKSHRCAALRDKKAFTGYLESRKVLRYAIEHKDEKKFYMAITDQRPYFKTSGKTQVKFFYDTVDSMDGAAALAHKTGLPVMFLHTKVVKRGRYNWELIPICEDASQMSVEDIMKEYYRMLEEEIRQKPEYYLWTHHRWWKP